jgi:excisionase family DNA binding protein
MTPTDEQIDLLLRAAKATLDAGRDDPWLSPETTADYLAVSVRMLEDLRRAGGGPQWSRFGGRLVRYRRSDVNAWALSQRGAAA